MNHSNGVVFAIAAYLYPCSYVSLDLLIVLPSALLCPTTHFPHVVLHRYLSLYFSNHIGRTKIVVILERSVDAARPIGTIYSTPGWPSENAPSPRAQAICCPSHFILQ